MPYEGRMRRSSGRSFFANGENPLHGAFDGRYVVRRSFARLIVDQMARTYSIVYGRVSGLRTDFISWLEPNLPGYVSPAPMGRPGMTAKPAAQLRQPRPCCPRVIGNKRDL